MHDIVIYTAVTDNYDPVRPAPPEATAGVVFVAFVSNGDCPAPWQPRPVHCNFSDPVRNAKIHKILPHAYFPDTEYSIWIDGALELTPAFSATDIVARYLKNADIAVLRHPSRTCVYDEAQACIQQGKDDPEIMQQQVDRYAASGYPRDAGLAGCSFIARRHTPAMRAFCERWYTEIEENSRRDQLSFNYVARVCAVPVEYFPFNILDSPYFIWYEHLLDRYATPGLRRQPDTLRRLSNSPSGSA